MKWENVTMEEKDTVATITINRPKAMNALNIDVLKDLWEAVKEIEKQEHINGVIITGAGDKAFVAGADVAQMKDMGVMEAREFSTIGQGVFMLVENLPRPVIAAVNGYALGGGLELAMSADIILATDKAQFGQPEVKLGVLPGFGGTQRLTRRVGINIAKEMIFTGKYISAQEALEIGLVNAVHSKDKLMDEANKLMNTILSNGPVAVELAKSAINDGADQDLRVGMTIERDAFSQCFATDDQKEGMSAFIDKRDPEFIGA